MESSIDVQGWIFGRGFNVGYAEALCKLPALLLRHFSQVNEINFIGNEEHWINIAILDSQYLRVEVCDVLVGLFVSHGVNQEETVALAHVLLTHSAKFLLSSGVQYCKIAVDEIISYSQ